MMNKKTLLITLSVSSILVLSIFIFKTNNNKEIELTELETNSFITESNSATFIADNEDTELSAIELADKYIKAKNEIEIFDEKEILNEDNLTEKQIKEFEEINLETEQATETQTEEINNNLIALANTETKLDLNNSVDIVKDNYTSSLSENKVDVVTETAPQETEPETQVPVENSIYTITNDEITAIENKGLELLELASQAGINTIGIDNSIKVMKTEAFFAPQGVEHFINVSKVDDCYNVDIYVTVNPEKALYNNLALQELCKLVSYNNSNVYDSIMEDFLNETLTPEKWTDSGKGFQIRYYGDKEKKLARYSIKY